MRVIQADHERRLEIPGVPGPVRRPVDIDAGQTGFSTLGTLRIYQFDEGSVIEGHAEEDEVFVVVLSGSIELKIGWRDSDAAAHVLSAAGDAEGSGFVAYLPPHSSYRLTPLTDADVAYARAIPLDSREPAIFRAARCDMGSGVRLLLDERTHASRLRLKCVRIDAKEESVSLALLDGGDTWAEALAHVHGVGANGRGTIRGAEGEVLSAGAWDTVVIGPGERPVLEVPQGMSLSVLAVVAI